MYYAQHSEDVRLRELIGGKRTGFYIDIGAWLPDTDSVTRHFYDDGWYGINVEPVPEYHEALARARPRDINVRVACGATDSDVELVHVHDSGLSTVIPSIGMTASIARPSTRLIVPQLTLASICRLYLPTDKEIDFLKIDVEGAEREVLIGTDWTTCRPNFLVIEAIMPEMGTPNWDAWSEIPIMHGYRFMLFDGLNRWYRRA